jgi:hypothetical protein
MALESASTSEQPEIDYGALVAQIAQMWDEQGNFEGLTVPEGTDIMAVWHGMNTKGGPKKMEYADAAYARIKELLATH